MASHGPSLWSLCPGQISSIMTLCPPAGHMMRRPGMATFRFFSMARIHWVILSRCGEWGLKWFKTLKKTTCRRTTFFLLFWCEKPGHQGSDMFWRVTTCWTCNFRFAGIVQVQGARGRCEWAGRLHRSQGGAGWLWRSVLSLVGWWKLKLAI